MRIFLIGFMGCGKSHEGKRLAQKLQWPFLDLDAEIERNEKKSISKIFEENGETHFRNLESKYLKKTVGYKKAIIATGGGTPCFNNNIKWMKDNGVVIYLKTPIEILAARLEKEKELRPLIANFNKKKLNIFIKKLLEGRKSYYEQANMIFYNHSDSDLVEELSGRIV